MKISLIICSFLVVGLSAAPAAISPNVINGATGVVQHATAVFAVTEESGAGLFGAGSIITDRHILTGGRLVNGAIRCHIGYGGTALDSLPFTVQSTTVVVHSAFDPTTLANDIAIIIIPMANRIVFSDTVRAIALPSAAPGASVQGSLAGFGITQSNGEISQTLLVASLVTADIAVCNDHFGVTFETHFCAIGRDGIVPGLISNSCPGDNGAAFYTGDGFITTTEDPDTGDGEEEGEGEAVVEEENTPEGDSENNAEDLQIVIQSAGEQELRRPTKPRAKSQSEKKSNENVIQEQVEPELVGIASAFGDYWVCNPTDPRAYTIVFNYLEWIQDLAGIEP